MAEGIRATVSVDSPAGCPVARVSAAADTRIDWVVRSVTTPGGPPAVTEFAVEAEEQPDTDLEPLFSHGSTHRYRFYHGGVESTEIGEELPALTLEGPQECPCECLGEFGCPIDRYVADAGTVTLVFYALDYDHLREIIAELRERFDDLDVKRLLRSPTDSHNRDLVLVDSARLTDRQREVLRTAYRMGYFDRPRGANASEVAAELDISASTFAEHLAAAQSKVFGDIFEERT